MASPYRYEERILKAASAHFAMHGFYGARVDNIAEEAKLNKRMVYEYNHTKEGLYLAVLSRVSRDIMDHFDQKVPSVEGTDDLKAVIDAIFSLLADSPEFVRLWAWEVMDETIHGPRILETVSEIFDRLYQHILTCASKGQCCSLARSEFDQILALCHGYLLSLAICLGKVQREQENLDSDNPEDQSSSMEDSKRISMENLQMIYSLQANMLNMIYQKIGLKV